MIDQSSISSSKQRSSVVFKQICNSKFSIRLIPNRDLGHIAFSINLLCSKGGGLHGFQFGRMELPNFPNFQKFAIETKNFEGVGEI